MKTVDFLDQLKAAYGLTSDYQLAKKLATSPARISNYRCNANFMDDAMCLKVAELLELDALFVVASVNIERAEKGGHPDMVKFWLGVVQQGGLNPATFATSAA
jgi:hypothetical protein